MNKTFLQVDVKIFLAITYLKYDTSKHIRNKSNTQNRQSKS